MQIGHFDQCVCTCIWLYLSEAIVHCLSAGEYKASYELAFCGLQFSWSRVDQEQNGLTRLWPCSRRSIHIPHAAKVVPLEDFNQSIPTALGEWNSQ